jgi:hypothetical protein
MKCMHACMYVCIYVHLMKATCSILPFRELYVCMHVCMYVCVYVHPSKATPIPGIIDVR